jgi:hypothetical protein
LPHWYSHLSLPWPGLRSGTSSGGAYDSSGGLSAVGPPRSRLVCCGARGSFGRHRRRLCGPFRRRGRRGSADRVAPQRRLAPCSERGITAAAAVVGGRGAALPCSPGQRARACGDERGEGGSRLHCACVDVDWFGNWRMGRQGTVKGQVVKERRGLERHSLPRAKGQRQSSACACANGDVST